jgi:hypothetical protein
MTRRAAATEAQIRRNINAALAAGLRVAGITTKPDGTVTVETVPLIPTVDDGVMSLEARRPVVL